MNVLFTILSVLVIIAAVLLTIIVLLQNGKGGGLASNFVAGNQTFGVRQTADILEKITWGLVAFIFIVSIVSSFALRDNSTDIVDKIENEASENIEMPSPNVDPNTLDATGIDANQSGTTQNATQDGSSQPASSN